MSEKLQDVHAKATGFEDLMAQNQDILEKLDEHKGFRHKSAEKS